jgi:hypothetical protein
LVVYDREGFPRATLEGAEGTSNVSESEDTNSTGKPKSCRTPRREVWWLDQGARNQSLESIKRRFEDCLDRFLLSSSSNSILRHITSPMDNKRRRNLHQCPGYLREEITLTSDVSKSVIISHAFPSQSEVCSICGQLVQYECTEPSILDGEKQEADSPPSPVLSDSDSIFPPSPTLSNHSSHHRFMTTLQLRDNRPEEKSGLSSLDLLNPDTFTRHRRKSLDTDTDSNFSASWTPPFPTSSNRSVHFLPEQLRDDNNNKPPEAKEKSGPFSSSSSQQSLVNPDSSKVKHRRKLSDMDSGSAGWIPRSPTLSTHSGRSSGPSHGNNNNNNNNKPEEKLFRFNRKGTTSSNNTAVSPNEVIKTEDLNDDIYSQTTISDKSESRLGGSRRSLSGFFSSLLTIKTSSSSSPRRSQSRGRFLSIG